MTAVNLEIWRFGDLEICLAPALVAEHSGCRSSFRSRLRSQFDLLFFVLGSLFFVR